MTSEIERKAVNALRVISAEAVQAAGSGHPGLPLGAAPAAYALFARHLRFNPDDPSFFDRDRFVFSAGHGSALLYSLLHLFGYGIGKEDLKNFRRVGGKTPGHPEYGKTPGVEATTGPLGQGVANAVGMAIAETVLAAKFNRDNFEIIDHRTYALCGDGCMEEGISYEAASLAGTLKLNKLTVLYDSNNITIEGDTAGAFSENVRKRHEALGWNTILVADGNDVDAVDKALKKAKKSDKPTLIEVKTKIGYGSPLEGSADSHGAPLGEKNVALLREKLNWTAAPFDIPDDARAYVKKITEAKKRACKKRAALLKAYSKSHGDLYAELTSYLNGDAVKKLRDKPPASLFEFPAVPAATRGTGEITLNRLADILPNLVGGSADLAPSNKSYMKGKGDYSPGNRAGRNIRFGIREAAMAAICNGIYLHGGLLPYCATFFVFSDYMKGSMRVSALMNIPVVYILTHDSIGVGEDGPTHQPVEQLAGMRAVPGLKVFRPCDGGETAAAYLSALTGEGPTAIVLSRQNLPYVGGDGTGALKGGYILSDCKKDVPDAILIASGSEVSLALDAQKILREKGADARVVSMPCMELFDRQSAEYRERVLPRAVTRRAAVEAASTAPWYKYVGLDGAVIGCDEFGESATPEYLFKKFGFTAENVAAKVLNGSGL